MLFLYSSRQRSNTFASFLETFFPLVSVNYCLNLWYLPVNLQLQYMRWSDQMKYIQYDKYLLLLNILEILPISNEIWKNILQKK